MDQKQQSGSGFINGLLLGIVLGAGIVLLFTSSKGRRILKIMSEDGFDSINNLDDLYQKLERALQDDEQVAPQNAQPETRTLIAQDVPTQQAPVQAPVVAAPVVPPSPVTQPNQVVSTPAAVVPEVLPVSAESIVAAPVTQQVPTLSTPGETPLAKPVIAPTPAPAVAAPEEAPSIARDEVEDVPQPAVKRSYIVAVDAQTSSKFAEVQKRLDEEIEAVSESIAQKFIAYADDEIASLEDIEDDEPKETKVKPARRRFFRGINRRA